MTWKAMSAERACDLVDFWAAADWPLTAEQVEQFFTWAVVGVIIGGRLGDVIPLSIPDARMRAALVPVPSIMFGFFVMSLRRSLSFISHA